MQVEVAAVLADKSLAVGVASTALTEEVEAVTKESLEVDAAATAILGLGLSATTAGVVAEAKVPLDYNGHS